MMEKQEVCNQHTAETRNNENICFYSSWILKMSLVMIWSCCLRGRIDKKKQHLKTLYKDSKLQALDPFSSKKILIIQSMRLYVLHIVYHHYHKKRRTRNQSKGRTRSNLVKNSKGLKPLSDYYEFVYGDVHPSIVDKDSVLIKIAELRRRDFNTKKTPSHVSTEENDDDASEGKVETKAIVVVSIINRSTANR